MTKGWIRSLTTEVIFVSWEQYQHSISKHVVFVWRTSILEPVEVGLVASFQVIPFLYVSIQPVRQYLYHQFRCLGFTFPLTFLKQNSFQQGILIP